MLVVSRKQDEEILIGTEEEIDNGTAIVVKVMRVGEGGRAVRVGIEAPGTTRILRGEIVAKRKALLCKSSHTAEEALSKDAESGISSSTK